MTTDEKKQALADAGIKLRANASEETILAAWDEFNATAPEPVDEVPEPAGEPTPFVPDPPAPLNPPVASNKKATRSEFEEVVIRLGTKQLGDRTPEVVAWARENLNDEEFEARYGGRNLDV